MTEPRISIVIPVYNGAEFLKDCITSILEQDYPALELILCDGGSTDSTLEIVSKYAEHFAYWSSEPDEGQADAINKGFAHASGDLVGWLNADDYFYPEALKTFAAASVVAPAAPFYFGNGYRVARDRTKLGEFFPDGDVRFRHDALIFGLNYVLQPATLIRRRSLEQIGSIDSSLQYGFDTDLWIRLSALGTPYPIRRTLAASREYGETKTASGSFRRAEELRQIAERHAGVATTPGAICYFLDTLRRLATERPDVFPIGYTKAIESFWSATAALMADYGARPDGFPLKGREPFPSFVGRASAGETLPAATDSGLPPRLTGQQRRARVGVELRQVTRGASGGIVVVLVGTLLELFKQRQDMDFIVFCTVFNRELLECDALNVRFVTLPLDSYFDELSRLSYGEDIDVLFRSYPTVEPVEFPVDRQIFVLPDVQHEHHPEFFDPASLRARREAFRAPLEDSGAIMTISEYARRTIEQLAAPGKEVFVASPSLPPDFLLARSEDVTSEERALLPENEFFYFPANLWPHKNHRRLLKAFREFRSGRSDPVELVLTGALPGWDELSRDFDDLPVRHLGYVRPALVRLCYERARALTFFSEYEGFGIPLLEAFATGTPVLCSNTTSLPEVAGDAALMCDPTDVSAMANLLERISDDATLRADLVSRGSRRYELYSWDTAAHELGGAIERVISQTKSSELSSEPLVSIVTPSFNHGRFLRRTIDSVLGQTYSNIEYIVMDGGSTDETLEVLRSYGDRIRWVSEPDAGQTDAINKGLRAASGEINAYLNSDDVLLPHTIGTVVRYLQQHPACDLVYGDADYIDVEDRVTGSYPTADYSFARLLGDCCICQPAAFWRASVQKTVGLLDERLHYAMDYEYWLRIDRAGLQIRYLPVTLACSRAYPETKTLSARDAIYHEVFDVSLRHGGYVSRNYVDGYWHYRAYEEGGRWLAPLRHVEGLRLVVVSAHHRWLNRHRYMRNEFVGTIASKPRAKLVARLQRMPRLHALVRRARARVGRGRRRQLGADLGSLGRFRVRGFWPDNWSENRLEVVIDERESTRRVTLAGKPSAEMTVTVSANGLALGEFDLARDVWQTVTLNLPAGPQETVTFAFSDYIVDRAGRRLSFLVCDTDLFREEDLLAS